MPPFERDSHRIVIAGASSLLGAELKSLLEESKFAGWDLRLVDEEVAAGTLTEAGGEPAVIQPVEEGSFEKADIIFFTGSSDFTLANWEIAGRSGAVIIDLSAHSINFADTFVWYPGIEKLRGQSLPEKPRLAAVPSAAAEGVVRLSLALESSGLQTLTATVLQSVSAAGKNGIEELETQTKQLLTFQSPGKELFDVQVAFNSLDRYGPARQADSDGADKDRIAAACQQAGFAILDEWGIGPNNISAAGETIAQLSKPHADRLQAGSWWFWGAADNIRLPAWNAVKLAEKLMP